MMTHQVRLKVLPWDDRPFIAAVEAIFREIEASDLAIDAPRAAELAQHRLRERGYPNAIVAYWRNVDEVLGHKAHWTVYRESPG
jgi:hypothetical protein